MENEFNWISVIKLFIDLVPKIINLFKDEKNEEEDYNKDINEHLNESNLSLKKELKHQEVHNTPNTPLSNDEKEKEIKRKEEEAEKIRKLKEQLQIELNKSFVVGIKIIVQNFEKQKDKWGVNNRDIKESLNDFIQNIIPTLFDTLSNKENINENFEKSLIEIMQKNYKEKPLSKMIFMLFGRSGTGKSTLIMLFLEKILLKKKMVK